MTTHTSTVHPQVAAAVSLRPDVFAAGKSMPGEQVSYDVVPSFFSDQYDTLFEYAGYSPQALPRRWCCTAT